MDVGSVFNPLEVTDVKVRQVSTTDATVTPIWRRTLNPSQVLRVRVEVVAQRDTGADRAAYVREFCFFRDGAGGAATQLGATATPVTDFESDATWDVTITTATNDVIVNVVGAAAKNVSWNAVVRALAGSF
jgi:hypothetical protein